jgi:hypothetical protein
MKNRMTTKPPVLRAPKGPRSSGLRGGAYGGPNVRKNRDDIHAVAAYTPGHKGAKSPKSRKPWY